MNSKAVGEVTEGIILAHFLKSGKSVSIPFGNNRRYDMILDDGDSLLKVQCKTGKIKNGCVMFWACSTNGFTGTKTGYKGQVDLFMVYCPDNGKVYRVPVDKIGETQVTLRIDPPKCSQRDLALAELFEQTSEINNELPNSEAIKVCDGHDAAILGLARRCSSVGVLVYSVKKIIETLMKRDGMSREEAIEFYEFNIVGSYVGNGTPFFLDDL